MRGAVILSLLVLAIALSTGATAAASSPDTSSRSRASSLALPGKGKLGDGRVVLKIAYSCPSTTSADDSLLWVYATQEEPHFAAGDTAVRVVCDGKRRKHVVGLAPNVGETAFSAGTVFVDAALGYGADSIHARDSRLVRVRR